MYSKSVCNTGQHCTPAIKELTVLDAVEDIGLGGKTMYSADDQTTGLVVVGKLGNLPQPCPSRSLEENRNEIVDNNRNPINVSSNVQSI